jgi:chromosome segregation ATPase
MARDNPPTLGDAQSEYWTAKKQVDEIDLAASALTKRLHANFTAIDVAAAKLKRAKTEGDTALPTVASILAGKEPDDPIAKAKCELDAANAREAEIRAQQARLGAARELAVRDVSFAEMKLDRVRAAVARPHVEDLLARREDLRARILSLDAALAAIQKALPAAMPYAWDSKRHVEPDQTLADQWRGVLEELTRIPLVKWPIYDSRIRRVERVVVRPDPDRFGIRH